ncbi:MAG TPA: TIGR03862 family flavoprotein [Quisquiliibacterium sp.]|nr:TIGR03862 family flavoprotein [Quisquiliibacterium sp.]
MSTRNSAMVVGGGPAGLMAAEALCAAGLRVDVYDSMPSVGRKFLLAGKGGLNLTHSEPAAEFLSRYGSARDRIAPLLAQFGPQALVGWVHELGIRTFVGSSGRVFPEGMKAAPLLRAWLHRLREAGVRFHMRNRWLGWSGDALRFASPSGESLARADAVVLALGGGSWPRLGSDAAWVPLLESRGVRVSPLRPANCGFDIGWSEHFSQRFAGHPMKSVELACTGASGTEHRRRGEFVITETGIEGSLVYAFSSMLRDRIAADGEALAHVDLAPGRSEPRLAEALSRPPGGRSLSNRLRVLAGLDGVKAALLRELLDEAVLRNPDRLAAAIKRLPLRLRAARPIDEAISSAGGVPFEALDDRLMLRALPGVFCAGEMLDWEAPTGGYLLSASFASGLVAGRGAAAWLGCAPGPDQSM